MAVNKLTTQQRRIPPLILLSFLLIAGAGLIFAAGTYRNKAKSTLTVAEVAAMNVANVWPKARFGEITTQGLMGLELSTPYAGRPELFILENKSKQTFYFVRVRTRILVPGETTPDEVYWGVGDLYPLQAAPERRKEVFQRSSGIKFTAGSRLAAGQFQGFIPLAENAPLPDVEKLAVDKTVYKNYPEGSKFTLEITAVIDQNGEVHGPESEELFKELALQRAHAAEAEKGKNQ